MQKRLLVKPSTEGGSKHTGSQQTDQAPDNDADKEGKSGNAEQQGNAELVDLRDLDRTQRQQIVDNALATNEESNETLLERYAERADKLALVLARPYQSHHATP